MRSILRHREGHRTGRIGWLRTAVLGASDRNRVYRQPRGLEGRVLISGAGKVFDSEGRVAVAATRDRIRTFIEGFAAFADAQRR